MPFIGNTPSQQAFAPAVDYFNGNASTVAFTLSRPVASVAQVQVTIENVPQNPSSAFTVSGSTITFTSAPPSGTSNIYVQYTSPITTVIAPGQGTVTATSMASSTGTGAGVFQTSPTITTPTISSLSSASATALTLQSAGTTAITVDTSQNVGIGTASPNAKLDVNGTIISRGNGAEGGEINFNNPDNTSTGMVIDVGVADKGRIFSTRNNYALHLGQLAGTGGSISLFTAAAERMRIDSSGNVGIGTSSPVNKLDVLGAAGCSYFAADTTITDTTLRTYTANTIYTLPGNVALLGTGGDTFLVSIFIQYDNLGYHSWTGSLVVSQTYWQAGGTVASWATQMSTHVNSNPTVTIYDTAGSGSRPMAFAVNQTIVVTTGGFVKVTFKRIMSF